MRNRYILLGDVFLIAFAAFAAFVLRLNWFFPSYQQAFLVYVVAALLIKPVVFYSFDLYNRFWRFASLQDMLAVFLGASAASIAMVVAILIGLVSHVIEGGFPRSIVLIDWLLTFTMVGGFRVSVRIAGESFGKRPLRGPEASEKRALIVGAGDAGAMIARELQRNPQLGINPVGFLDDERIKIGKRILGIPVLGMLDGLRNIVASHRIAEVIIAMPRSSGEVVRSVAEACQQLGVNSRTVPGIFELLNTDFSVQALRPIEISDLLRREPVEITFSQEYLEGQTVLVTGAGGSIGSELCRQIARARPSSLILFGHGENTVYEVDSALRALFSDVQIRPIIGDIRDRTRLEHVFQRFRPSIVFHAAAHKHVPLMEENPEEAVTNNVFGTLNLVGAAQQFNVKRLVLISTDKAVSPSSVMGASKRLAERIVYDAARRSGKPFIVVRFGNVLGSSGSVVPRFKQQIEAGGPISITHPDMTRYFMTIPEAVHLVLQAGRMGRGSELFVLKMGPPVKIVDLACDMIRLSGFERNDIPIVFTGLRRGEKLEEMLWEKGSDVIDTPHSQILRVIEHGRDQLEAIDVAALKTAAEGGDPQAIVAALAGYIPTFTPFVDPDSVRVP